MGVNNFNQTSKPQVQTFFHSLISYPWWSCVCLWVVFIHIIMLVDILVMSPRTSRWIPWLQYYHPVNEDSSPVMFSFFLNSGIILESFPAHTTSWNPSLRSSFLDLFYGKQIVIFLCLFRIRRNCSPKKKESSLKKNCWKKGSSFLTGIWKKKTRLKKGSLRNLSWRRKRGQSLVQSRRDVPLHGNRHVPFVPVRLLIDWSNILIYSS